MDVIGAFLKSDTAKFNSETKLKVMEQKQPMLIKAVLKKGKALSDKRHRQRTDAYHAIKPQPEEKMTEIIEQDIKEHQEFLKDIDSLKQDTESDIQRELYQECGKEWTSLMSLQKEFIGKMGFDADIYDQFCAGLNALTKEMDELLPSVEFKVKNDVLDRFVAEQIHIESGWQDRLKTLIASALEFFLKSRVNTDSDETHVQESK